MANVVQFSVDLTKIPEDKIITKDKEGNPFKNNGKYVNLTMFIHTEANEYGYNAALVLTKPKESTEPKIYVGNGKSSEKIDKVIQFSVDLNKIPEDKIITKDKEGNLFKNNGKYVNLTMFVQEELDDYGHDAAIIITKPKESTEPKIYVGNGMSLDKINKSS